MSSIFIAAFLIGLAFCAPPGAITAEAIRRGVRGGFRPALLVELGSLIGDATWAIIALVGLAVLVQLPFARLGLGLLGASLLLYLAWDALRAAYQGGAPQLREIDSRGAFLTGAFMSLGNPWNIVYWAGAGSPLTTLLVAPHFATYVVFFIGFMLAAVIWCFLMASLIAWGRQFITPRFFRLVNLICGLFLGYFGLQLLRTLFAG
ncbi:MAG: LysE family transporter [Chloroflexi bacterium]|nr:LysE family transporter [Chloroflexota bacterium]